MRTRKVICTVLAALLFAVCGGSRMWAQAPQDSVAVEIQADTLSLSDQLIAYAREFLGTPYKLGASGPFHFDCSSYTRYVFKHFGFDITA